MNNQIKPLRAALILLSILSLQTATTQAQGTAFTYQGQLSAGGSPANGNYDFTFALFNNNSTNTGHVGTTVTNLSVGVTNGLFTSTIDFGAGVFTGTNYWLALGVRTNGGANFTALNPLQELTPTPYAIYTPNAGNATTAISATSAAMATTASNLSGSLAGDVTGTQSATVVSAVGGQTAANVASGTSVANAASSTNTPNTIVKRDASGNLSAGTITANLAGNATTATTATNLVGSVSDAQLSANIARLNGTNAFTGTNTFTGVTLATNPANNFSGTFTGNLAGNATTATTATNLIGNVSDAQLSANIARLNGTNAFAGTNTFAGVTRATNVGNVFNGTFTGNLAGNATTATSAITSSTATTASTSGNFTGSLSGDVTGTQSATVVSTVGGVTSANVAIGANAANAATSTNTASTIVKRDASGNFAAGTITATSLNGAFSGNGSALTAIPLTALQTLPLTNGQGGVTLNGNFAGSGAGLTGVTAASLAIPPGMALIPAGAFLMGDSLDGETDAIPVISVTVSAFYMDVNLVSLSQWQSVYYWATSAGYSFDDAGAGKAANNPVQTVNWYDTVKWSNARSQQAGLIPVYYTDTNLTQVYTNGDVDAVYANWTANGYRLPTEAEWEKAARGGLSGLRFPWGNVITENLANYIGDTSAYSYDLGPNGNSTASQTGGEPYTTPVGYFAPNDYGLYDMAGNVHEWCWDWYGTPYAGGSDPHGPASDDEAGDGRVLRGGRWQDDASICHCAARWSMIPSDSPSFYGFRCVRGL
jgi:formylglycine-generating enzyme